MKASDISDQAFLDAVTTAARKRGIETANQWDVAAILAGHPEDVGTGIPSEVNPPLGGYPNMPAKVVLAKARSLIKRGLIDGCACDCRGDFVVK